MAQSNLNSQNYSLAKSTIDDVMNDLGEDEEASLKAYLLFGQIYQACLENEDPAVNQLVKSYEVYDIWNAYQKVLELDAKGKYGKKVGVQYKNLKLDFMNYAIEQSNDDEFGEAFKTFEMVLAIDADPLYIAAMGGTVPVDTVIIYQTAVCAYQDDDYPNAEKYFRMVIPYDFRTENCYQMLYSVLKQQDKMDDAVACLAEGIKLFPTNEFMLIEMINYYMDSEDPMEAVPYLDEAIAVNPESVAFIRAKAQLYEKSGHLDEAVKLYNDVLDIDPNDFASIYELATIKLDEVDTYRNEVQNITNNAKYTEGMNEVYKMYVDVAAMFERAEAIQPDDRNTLYTLRQIYYNLRNYDEKVYGPKYEEITNKL